MIPIFVITISDILAIIVLISIAALFLIVMLPIWIKSFRCSHDGGVSETSACDAICLKCGKNLGFIGSWKEKNDNRISRMK